jgi:hypothetical protein
MQGLARAAGITRERRVVSFEPAPVKPSDPPSRGHPAIAKSVKFELGLPTRCVETSPDRIGRHEVGVFHGVVF